MTQPSLKEFSPRRFTLATLADTQALAQQLAGAVSRGDVLLLTGPVGVGKTTFTGFLLGALGVSNTAPSPTYALHTTYSGPSGDIHHLDLYRLDSLAQFESLDPWEIMANGFLTLIEWADNLPVKWPQEAVTLAFSFNPQGQREAVLK